MMEMECVSPECAVICSKHAIFTEEDKKTLLDFLGRWKYRQLKELALDIAALCRKKNKSTEK